MTGLPLYLFKKKLFSSHETALYAQKEAQFLSKKENDKVNFYALKPQQLIEKGWCIESAPTINLKCIETFTRGLPKNLENFAQKCQIKHTITVMEPSFHFIHRLNLLMLKILRLKKILTLDLPLEIYKVTSRLKSQNSLSATYAPSPEVIFTQTTDRKNRSKTQFRKNLKFCLESNHSVSKCFRKQRANEKRKRIS